jgi:hypothetical protein
VSAARLFARASLAAALASGGCSRRCACSDPPAVSDAGPGGVEILEPGKPPLVRLEAGRWTGLRYALTLGSGSTFGVEGLKPAQGPESTVKLRFEVVRGAADPILRRRGTQEVRCIEERIVVESVEVRSKLLPAGALARTNESLSMLHGTTTRQLVAEDGEVVEIETELIGGVEPTPEAKNLLDEQWNTLRRFPFRLPSVPVGLGARWRFSEQIELNGVRAVQVSEMTLTAMDAATATVRFRVRHHAPRQEITLAALDAGAMLESYRGDGDGEIVLDRETAVALRSHLQTTGRLRVSADGPGGKKTLGFVASTVTNAHTEIEHADAGDEDAPSPPASAAPSALAPPASATP